MLKGRALPDELRALGMDDALWAATRNKKGLLQLLRKGKTEFLESRIQNLREIIDDAPAATRWAHIAKDYTQYMPAVTEYFESVVPAWAVPLIEAIAGSVTSYFTVSWKTRQESRLTHSSGVSSRPARSRRWVPVGLEKSSPSPNPSSSTYSSTSSRAIRRGRLLVLARTVHTW